MERITVYIADTRALKPCLQAALPLLNPARRAAAERISPEQDRLHTVGAGLLLRRVLGVTSDEALTRNEFGKPELAAGRPCFSLSHGGALAVLAVSPSAVGVDVEPVGERVPAVSGRFLRPDELAWLEKDPAPARFARLWTRLESALKADGRGLALKERDFSVLESGHPWHLDTVEFEGHILSCAAAGPFELSVVPLPTEELMQATP